MNASSSTLARERGTPWWVPLTLSIGLGLLAVLAWRECSYYLAPLEQQALDPRHERLRSSGAVGLALGVIAAGLIVLNLLYLLRRRLLAARFVGSIRGWLDLHVVSGLLAGGCVALHAAGHVRSASATMASGALAIVVITGVIGRYVLAQVPRTREGHELSLDQAHARFEELRQSVAELGLPPFARPPALPITAASKLRALLGVLFGDRTTRAAARRYRAALAERTPDATTRARILPQLDRLLREADRLARLNDLTALMAAWRFLHRWLALVMIGTAACHVALAIRWGELRFGELSLRELLP